MSRLRKLTKSVRKKRRNRNTMGDRGKVPQYLKSSEELAGMRKAGHLLQKIMLEVMDNVQVGVTTLELDKLAYSRIKEAGARPGFLNLYGFPNTLCISPNEQVVHGIPTGTPIMDGDIVSVDCGLVLDGWFADMAYTRGAGEITPEAKRLLAVTQKSLFAGIAAIEVEGRLSEVGGAIEDTVHAAGYHVVDEYGGHGIGKNLHEDPHVHNRRKDPGGHHRIKAGLTIAIEPMVNIGTARTETLEDKWTVVTLDGSLSAHFEHTVGVCGDGLVEILTQDPALDEPRYY